MKNLKFEQHHVLVLGSGQEAVQLSRIAADHVVIVGIKNLENQHMTSELSRYPNIKNSEDTLGQIDTVILTSDYDLATEQLIEEVCGYLKQGIHVISTQNLSDLAKIEEACQLGQANFQITNIFPHAILEQLAMTLSKALSRLDYLKVTQAVILQNTELTTPQLQNLGFGLDLKQAKPLFKDKEQQLKQALKTLVSGLFGKTKTAALEFKTEILPILAKQDIQNTKIVKNTIAAVNLKQGVYQQDRCILEIEEFWTADRQYLNESKAIYGNYNQNLNFNVQVHGEPSLIDAQLEFSSLENGDSALALLNAQAVMNTLNLLKNQMDKGVYLHESQPKYQIDDRLNTSVVKQNNDKPDQAVNQSQAIKKVIIWGPGEIGGSVVRAILQRPNIKVVGAKVFSPHKNGKDLGELVGIEKLGIYATNSSEELLALDADCVIVTPQPRAIVEGLDLQVMEILKAGKNVITSAAYHNVTMPNWLMNAQQPTQLLAEAIHTHGIAKNAQEEMAFKLLKKLENPIAKLPLLKKFRPVVDQALRPIFNKLMPPRTTPQALQQACNDGKSFLHGTGVHPSFMAERIGIMLANFLSKPKHMRFIEAVDFSYMPDGMWGGLNTIGFGLLVDELDENFIVAKAGDFYYGDVTGNVGHLLFGATNQDIRVERRFRAIPAKEDFKVGSTIIKKGHAAALHMMHLGYIGDHHFFTNEECWYLGPNEEFRGENLPFGHFETPISYTVEVTSESSHHLKMQLSMDGSGRFAEILQNADISTADRRCALGQVFREEGTTNPITNATAMAILDAVEGIQPNTIGIVIDDIRPRLRKLES